MEEFVALLLDVGNSGIGFGVSDRSQIIEFGRLDTKDYEKGLSSVINKYKPVRVLVSSVVPRVCDFLVKVCLDDGIEYYECGKNLEIPVRNLYKNPGEVGQDRLLNVYGVNTFYKDEGIRLVIDIGTALTFDFMTDDGAYRGGLIFPGMQLSLDSLLEKCVLLPKDIKLSPAETLYAKDTKEGINNGIVYGFSFMLKGLIGYLKEKEGDFKTLLTGGSGSLLVESICGFDFYDENLAIKGLNELVGEYVK